MNTKSEIQAEIQELCSSSAVLFGCAFIFGLGFGMFLFSENLIPRFGTLLLSGIVGAFGVWLQAEVINDLVKGSK